GLTTPEYDHTRSSIGLAVLSPALDLLARHTEPVILPDKTYDNLGVEDARITKIGSQYVMFYTAYSSGIPENIIRIAIATTTDFIHWNKHGLLDGEYNTIHNKNAMLFENTMNQKYIMLHRPMQGDNAMAIHWAESNDIFGKWKSNGVLMNPLPNPIFTDTWIGGGAPPLQIAPDTYLIIYHIGNRNDKGEREYDLGIAIADFSTKKIIIKRNEPLLRPHTAAETVADKDLGVGNVLFICGAYFYNGDLYFPYAGADSVVLGGRISKSELQEYLSS
ncbi:MAG TPA: glycosidase, partial [Bacteroidota bacterium]|nr:glycosidase [Bacteroidota bacterium]